MKSVWCGEKKYRSTKISYHG